MGGGGVSANKKIACTEIFAPTLVAPTPPPVNNDSSLIEVFTVHRKCPEYLDMEYITLCYLNYVEHIISEGVIVVALNEPLMKMSRTLDYCCEMAST